MTDFVRAVAVARESVLARYAPGVDRAIGAVDEIRRRGTHVILMTTETIDELADTDARLLPHFDAVVAESGAVLQVGPGPAKPVPGRASRRRGFLAALSELDVDPHDSLAISGDRRDVELLDASEVSVAVGDADAALRRRVDISLHGGVDDALEQLLDDVLDRGPGPSPERHDVRIEPSGGGGSGQLIVPGAHANVVLCAPALPRPDVPQQLLHEWVAAGYQCLVLDPYGRFWGGGPEQGLPPATRIRTRVDSGEFEFGHEVREQLESLLVHQPRVAIADLSGVLARDRSRVITEALLTVQRHRARGGRPHWLVIDDAETVLSDPNLPPEALSLDPRGYCLILRSDQQPPASLARVVDVVLPPARP